MFASSPGIVPGAKLRTADRPGNREFSPCGETAGRPSGASGRLAGPGLVRRRQPVVANVLWHRDVLRDPLLGHGLLRDQSKGKHAGPHRQRDVLLVVLRAPGSHLGGGLVQPDPQDSRLAQLDVAGAADVVPAAGRDVLGDDLQRVEPLPRVVHLDRGAEDHDRAVVHRVVEGRTGQHQAVLDGDGHADRGAPFECPQHPAGGGAVEVQAVAIAGVDGGDDVGLAVHHEADVADQGLVQDGVDRLPVVRATFEETRGRSAFVIVTPALKAEVRGAGLVVIEGEEGAQADFVVVGGHDGFTYDELRIATHALRRGAAFYATGRDATFPMPDGPWPAAGAILAAVETAAGRPARVIGKPEPEMFLVAREMLGEARRTVVVGDRLDSDIAGGHRAGLATVLVLTGSTTEAEAASASPAPDFVIPDLQSLVQAP